MAFHHEFTPDEHGIHTIVAYKYANAAARAAATGFTAVDVGKVSRQLDDGSFWILTAYSPITWQKIGIGAGTRMSYSEADVSTTSSGAPLILALDTDAVDVAVFAATTVGVGGGWVRLPAASSAMYGKIFHIWNVATLGLLTVRSETGTTINTLNPPTGGAIYICVNAGSYKWQKVGGAGDFVAKTDYSAKGAILVGTGSGTYAALTVGDNGQALVADSTQASGVKWDTISGGGGTGGYETMPADATTSSSVITFDPVTNGWHQRVTLAHNMTSITITKPTSAADRSRLFTVDFAQGAGGSNLYTLPSAEASWTNCRFPGGVVPPVMTGTNGIITKFVFQWNGRRDYYELIDVVFAL